jgi:hypothetical protein
MADNWGRKAAALGVGLKCFDIGLIQVNASALRCGIGPVTLANLTPIKVLERPRKFYACRRLPRGPVGSALLPRPASRPDCQRQSRHLRGRKISSKLRSALMAKFSGQIDDTFPPQRRESEPVG